MSPASRTNRLVAGGHGADAAFAWLVRGFVVAGGFALVVMVVTVVVAVVARYGLNEPIFGAEDISAMALVVVVASAIVYGAWDNAHVAVDAIDSIAPQRATRVTDVVARLLGAATAAMAAFALFRHGACGAACGATTPSLLIVHTPFYYALASAFAAVAGMLLTRQAVLWMRRKGQPERVHGR